MNWLHYLFESQYVVQICANVVVLSFVYPAYKRTKHRAFLLLFFAYLIATFEVVCDLTIGQTKMARAVYISYHTLRYLTYIADCILFATGMVLLFRAYINLDLIAPPSEDAGEPDTEREPGFIERFLRAIEK